MATRADVICCFYFFFKSNINPTVWGFCIVVLNFQVSIIAKIKIVSVVITQDLHEHIHHVLISLRAILYHAYRPLRK